MKLRGLLGVAISIVLVASCLTFAACNRNDEKETFDGAYEAHSVYAIGAVTSAKLLDMSDVSAVNAVDVVDEAAGKAIGEAEEFNKYFNMLDSFLDTADIQTEDSVNTDSSFDYERKLKITGKNANGDSIVHTFYYTQTLTNSSDREYRDDGETIYESTENYALTGIIGIGENEDKFYDIKGTRYLKLEREGAETERTESINLRAYVTGESDGKFVEVSHTSQTEEERGETETESLYIYKVCNPDGTIAEQTEIEFETEEEKGETETEYTMKFVKGESRGYYEIEREQKNGRYEIAVIYNIDGERGRFTIVKGADGYVYKFSDSDTRTYKDYKD